MESETRFPTFWTLACHPVREFEEIFTDRNGAKVRRKKRHSPFEEEKSRRSGKYARAGIVPLTHISNFKDCTKVIATDELRTALAFPVKPVKLPQWHRRTKRSSGKKTHIAIFSS